MPAPPVPDGWVSPGQLGEIARGRLIGLLDPRPDPILIAVPELGKVGWARVAAGRQHVHRNCAGQRGHFLVEPVPAGDLERDQPHLPGPARHGQRAFDPPHLQDVDGAGAQGDGPADRNGIDQPAVEIVLAVHLHRREQPGHRAGGQYGGHDRPGGEPAGAGPLDAGRDALEGQLEIGELLPGQGALQHAPQWLDGMQVGAGLGQPGQPSPDALAERLAEVVALPQVGQPRGRSRGVRRHERTVDGADRGSYHQVGPDAGLGQGAEHADLVRAEDPAAA